MDRLFEAYFRDCLDVSDRNVLESLARKEGLDTAFLDTDAYIKEVQEDELDARRMGIYAVPYFVINREYTFDGAMPQQFFNNVLLLTLSAARQSGQRSQPWNTDAESQS